MEKISVYIPGLETEGSKLAAQQAMHSQYVLQLLQLQRRAGFLCDITVTIQEKSFKAHKPLLAACSLYFRALFANSENAKTSTLNFEKLSPSGFEVLLDYIYSGSLAITSENSDLVLHAANCLQMTNVVETCLNFIRSSFKATAEGAGKLEGLPTAKDMQMTAESTPRVHLATPTIPAIQPNFQDARQFPQADGHSHLSMTMPQQPLQSPQVVPTQLSQSQLYDHNVQLKERNAQHNGAFEHAGQNHVMRAMNSHVPEVQQNAAVEQPTSHIPLANPTSETLTMLMPYLVAKNARRPTLNEVRQLLISGQRPGNLPAESPERYALKQAPPALIPAGNAAIEENQRYPSAEASLQNHHEPIGFSPEKHLPLNMTTPQSKQISSVHRSEENSTTSQTTVHAGQTFNVNSTHLTSKEMQPFVLMTSGNNFISQAIDDSGKGCAWSDDRSVGSNQNSDRSATHLSGTPCSANLTQDGMPQPPYSATSPASFGSTPSIEISPISTTTSADSPIAESRSPQKVRCARAQSLDFSKISTSRESIPVNRSMTRSVEDFRSVSLSPEFFKLAPKNSTTVQVPGDHSSLISAEQAASAVGALFVRSAQEKTSPEHSPLETHSSVDASSSLSDESRLVIEENPEMSNPLPDTDVESRDSNSLPKRESDQACPTTYFPGNVQNETPLVKKEPEYTSRTSPPPEECFSSTGREEDDLSRSSSTQECSVDENGVLDLSMHRVSSQSVPKVVNVFSAKPVIQTPQNTATSIAQGRDPKAQEALDALVMMQNTIPPKTAMPPQAIPTLTSHAMEENSTSLTFGFSRKPRRSSGGQTCQWPGCGRLFRHRNIYEEHKKLHERGVPVQQLRKCYMGARVKKTARERLEEMRMVEGASGSQTVDAHDLGPNSVSYQRPSSSNRRKRSSNSHKDGTDRKRVTAKDRKDRNLPWQPRQSSQATIQHTPLFSHAPSIPLAVLQAVSSGNSLRQPWPGPLPGSAGPGPPLNVLGYPLHGPNSSSDPNQVSHHSSAVASNNPAVVETLAALGIPIPTKRDAEEHAARVAMHGGPIRSPSNSMTLDQLRRSIALRESAVLGATSSGNPEVLVGLQQPIHLALSSLRQSQQGTGKVTGNHFTADSAPPHLIGAGALNHTSSEIHMPVPNSYHGSNAHGPKCS